MTITIQRADLARALSAAVKATETRNTIPILGNVLLSAADGTLTVTATDLDIMVSSMAPCEGAIETTVDARRLADIAKRVAGDTVTLSLTDGALVVKSGRSRFSLPTLPVDDFPKLEGGQYTATFDVDFAALVAPVKFAISSEQTRYYLCGVNLHLEGDTALRAVSTDGHRLSYNSIPTPEGIDSFFNVIIQAKTVGIVPAGMVTVSLSSNKARFVTADTVIVSKLIDGTFPDYKRVIPQSNDKQLTISRKELSDAVGRVASVATERGRAAKFSVAGDNVSISVLSTEGTANEDVPATYSAEPIEIGFNSQYVSDVLGSLSGDEVTIELGDPGSPALFKGAGSGEVVLMPMRV